MKKVVVRVNMFEAKDKKKALKAVSCLSGVDSISVNMKDKILTVIGDVDPVEVVEKLRKTWNVELVTVGPDKEPEKKNDQAKKEDDKKKNNTTSKESEQAAAEFLKYYKSYNYNNYMTQPAYMTQQPAYMAQQYAYNVEDNPNSCVIC